MNFGEAIEALKQDHKVARIGWNGKGMWLALTHGSTIDRYSARSGATLRLAETGVSEIMISPHIDMKAADGSITIGWNATQIDMLAEDWQIVV